jgi:DNA-binding HxlR family transcriptional regulator
VEKRRPWTAREDALICRLRQRDLDYDAIAQRLSNRTPGAVQVRVARLITLGRTPSFRAAWTAEEDQLLCELAAKDAPLSEMVEQFPRRSTVAVVRRLRHMRLEGSIDGKPVTPVPARRWTAREESILVAMRAENATMAQLERRLPHRTRKAIEQHVKELIASGIIEPASRSPRTRRPWSKEEDDLVTAMRKAGKPESQMAAALGRTLPSVRTRIAERVRKGELERR